MGVSAHYGGVFKDGFIDQHLFTADRTTVKILDGRGAKGFVQVSRWDRLVTLATHTALP